MYWNYRVLRHTTMSGETTYHIHEVYYDKNGVPQSCTVSPVGVSGVDMQDLAHDMMVNYRQALHDEILDYDDFT